MEHLASTKRKVLDDVRARLCLRSVELTNEKNVNHFGKPREYSSNRDKL